MTTRDTEAWRPPKLNELLEVGGHLTRSISILENVHGKEDIVECSAVSLPVVSAYHRELVEGRDILSERKVLKGE